MTSLRLSWSRNIVKDARVRPLRLTYRIALGFSLLLTLLAAMGGIGGYFVDRASRSTAELHHHAYVASQALAETRAHALEIKAILLRQMAGSSPSESWVTEIRRHQWIAQQNLAIAASKSGPDDSSLRMAWRELGAYVDKSVVALRSGEAATVRAVFDKDGIWQFDRFNAAIADAIVAANAEADEHVGQAERLRGDLLQGMIAIGAVALILGGIISTSLTLSLVTPLVRLVRTIRELDRDAQNTAIPYNGRSDEIGDIARALMQLRDDSISRQRTELQFRLIFQATPDIVTITERDSGLYLDVNAGFESILGYKRDEVIGRTSLELGIWATPRHRADVVTALMRDGRLSNFPSRGRRKNGELFDSLISAEQFKVGERDCMIFVVRDITSLKQKEELLRQSLAELERSNRELEHVAHVTAHDLQEPCRTLCSFAQLLARSDAEHLSDEGKEYLGFLSAGAIRMREQIQGLLDYSRVAANHAAFIPVTLDRVLDEVLSEQQSGLHDHHGTVQRSPLPVVAGDATQLRQLFSSLISNALKFQPPGNNAEITIQALRRGSMWEISISDNGIGIEAPYHEVIFDLFRRLHGPDKYPGNGLGLTIAKRIVERHGGMIWLESMPGAGTTISFTLPAAP